MLQKQKNHLTIFVFLMALGLGLSKSARAGNLPDRLNFEILPVTMSATHPRGAGFGFSLEKLGRETRALTAINTEVSIPVLGHDQYTRTDWNGSFTLMGPLTECVYIGGKVGVAVNYPGNQIGFMALSMRAMPVDPYGKKFLKWVTKQIDLGILANKNLYAAVRFGFSIL